ncbi:substrate-binding domain-containing protein [Plebeiibacterium marinum]|uniref:Substrate-binding domain-containing protein n=1 Tax=Plebeiibacterium marinum TaxID=2992111 RepID=A0AAE3SKN1_9BACT|nr:substrate-binding domain-containing protein [Plebeiobacterium marinum]MCW3807035.1 substrate-binding domain-containing protein [Plebeiobacterium marinum]
MKKINNILLLLFALLPIAGFAQRDSVHVGFILADLYSERWHHDMDYFESRMEEHGAKVTFIDCFDRAEKQTEAAKKLIQDQVDCIVIVPIDVNDTSVVSLSKVAGIPVVTYDRFMFDPDVKLCVSFNSVRVGEMMAEQVVSKLKGGRILYLGGPSTDYNSALVRRGVFSVLRNNKQYSTKSIRTEDWSELSAFIKVQSFLSQNNYVPDAIICASDDLTKGALLAVEEAGALGKILLTGQDGNLDICRNILKGNVLMSVYKSNKILANAAADAVVKIIREQDIDLNEDANTHFFKIPAIFEEPELLMKENLEEILVSRGVYTEEQLSK